MLFFGVATISNLGMIYVTPLYISLIGRGDLRFIFRSQTIVAVTNLMVSVVLIPQLGLLGAAFGLLCATAYNVVAIYLRHERTVGESGGLVPAIRGHTGRYVIAILLFASAILIGIEHTVNYFAAAAILLAIAIIMKGEPLVSTLLERMKGCK
jgi:O-antigen/teichoic acid export membrane protein